MGLGPEQRNPEPRICQCGCKETFYPFPMYPRDGNGEMQRAKYMVGHNPKMKETQFGKVTAWNKGKKKGDHPSLDRMGFQKGHPAYYISPKSTKPYVDPKNNRKWRELRLVIQKRDRYTCQICGDHNYKSRGSSIKLHVDHIVPASLDISKLYDPSNLRTLCFDCHLKTDTWGGRIKRIKKQKRLESRD